MSHPTPGAPASAGATSPSRPSRWTLLLWFAVIVIVALLAWALFTAPILRVTPDAAQTWMSALDARITQRIDTAVRSDERAAINIDFGQKTVDSVYLANLNHAADQVKQFRVVLLERAAIRLQADLLRDIAELTRAMESCSPHLCEDVTERVHALTNARVSSIGALHRLDGVMTRSYDLARPGAVSFDNPDSVLALHTLVLDTMNDASLLARRTDNAGFDDVIVYQGALWEIVDLHADLTAEYQRRHRMVAFLHLLLGRLS